MSTEENKAIVRRYQEAYNTNNLDALDALVTVDLISHDLVPGLPQGLASGKLVHQRAVAAMPDYQAVIEDLIAEGDQVVARMTIKGTHSKADFLGLPATGRRINVPAISIFRIANGKIVEHWAASDTLGLLQQLGVLPAP